MVGSYMRGIYCGNWYFSMDNWEEASMTDKAKLYVVKNDKGKYLKYNAGIGAGLLLDAFGGIHQSFIAADEDRANGLAYSYNGHVVELVEAPAKVVVSEEEAEMLEQAKCDDDPAELIVGFVNSHDQYDGDGKTEDRLMRAYVNGWTVEKPKLFLVKVPHTDDSYFYKIDDEYCNAGDSYHLEGMTDKKWFTIAEIEHYGLGDYQKVVCADSARTTGEVTDD